jgi:hypothetical protein
MWTHVGDATGYASPNATVAEVTYSCCQYFHTAAALVSHSSAKRPSPMNYSFAHFPEEYPNIKVQILELAICQDIHCSLCPA